MKYVVAPEFGNKLVDLPPALISEAGAAIALIENSSFNDLKGDPSLMTLSQTGLFALRKGSIRIFLSFFEHEGEAAAILMDIAAEKHGKHHKHTIIDDFQFKILPQSKNPNFVSKISPRFNANINPAFNATINPKFNSYINPSYNSNLNPKYNSIINPNFNSSLNPKFNSNVNPLHNWSIRPGGNATLNTIAVFDINAKQTGYLVAASDSVLLHFNTKHNWIGFCAKHLQNGFVVFNTNIEWIEHWESNGDSGYNRFDLENRWIGFVF